MRGSDERKVPGELMEIKNNGLWSKGVPVMYASPQRPCNRFARCSRICLQGDQRVAGGYVAASSTIGDGTDLASTAILRRQEDRKVEWHDIAPGRPMRNGFVQNFNSRLRDECMNEHLFANRRPLGSNRWRLHGTTMPEG